MHLPDPAGIAQLETYVAEQRAHPLDRDRPLWDITLVESVVLDDGRTGSALVCRFHHAIADGVRLTQVMLSLCDTSDPGVSAMVARTGPEGGPVAIAGSIVGVAREAIADTARAVARGASALTRDTRQALVSSWEIGGEIVRSPGRLIDVFEAMGLESRLANTTASVAKLALRGSTVHTVWSGKPGVRKAVAWSPPMPLDEVKAVGRAHDASINDVLLTAVAGGMRRYLHARGSRTSTRSSGWCRSTSSPSPRICRRTSATSLRSSWLCSPSIPPIRRAPRSHSRPHGSDQALGGADHHLRRAARDLRRAAAGEHGLTDFFANKAVGVLTNVPGPRAALTFAGVAYTR